MPSAAEASQLSAPPAQPQSQQSTAVTDPTGAQPGAVRHVTHQTRAEAARFVGQASHRASHIMLPAAECTIAKLRSKMRHSTPEVDS